MLFVLLDLFQPLSVDFEKVVASSHSTRLELPNVVEGCLQIVEHMFGAQDVTSHMMMWGSTDELSLVSQNHTLSPSLCSLFWPWYRQPRARRNLLSASAVVRAILAAVRFSKLDSKVSLVPTS